MVPKLYKITLNPKSDRQDYEQNNSNLAWVGIQLPNGSIVYGQEYTSSLTMSVDGMLGMGMELIRLAMQFKHSQRALLWEELMPIHKDFASQGEIGVCLTYDSCSLHLFNQEWGTYLQQIKLSKAKNAKLGECSTKQKKANFFSEQISDENQVFEIDLHPDINELQIYEKNNANLMRLIVELPNKKIISNNDRCIVCIRISIDGMLGFGTELVRKALKLKRLGTKELPKVERLKPIGPAGGSSGSLGIFLTHDSCNLLFSIKDLGTVEQQLKLFEK